MALTSEPRPAIAVDPAAVAVEPAAPTPKFPQERFRPKLPPLSALAFAAPIGPLLMLAATAAIFIAGETPVVAILGGLAVGGVGWLVIGAVAASASSVDRANPSLHRELSTRLNTLYSEHADEMSPELLREVEALSKELAVESPAARREATLRTQLAELSAAAAAPVPVQAVRGDSVDITVTAPPQRADYP